MNTVLSVIIAALFGASVGFSVTLVFNRLPESWLQDYGYDVKSPDFRLAKRMKLYPHGVISAILVTAFYVMAALTLYNRYIETFRPIHLAVILLLAPVVIVVMMSDRLNRIIPDQCSLFILILGVLSIAGDLVEGSLWFSPEAKWFAPIINRVLAMLIGYGLLWLINFLCVTFLGKEGMGQGDMGGPMGQGFEQGQTAAEEELTTVPTGKSLSEFGPETWILLGTSFLAIFAAILFALKFKRY